MRIRPLLFVFGALALSLSAPAFAKKDSSSDSASTAKALPTIEATGISEFDPTFMKAKTIQDTLVTAQNKLATCNKGLATALALPETTSLDEALSQLKTKANGKIKVAMQNGKLPKLSAADAVPPEVQTGIDAVNALVDDLGASLDQMTALPPEATALAGEVSAFPGQLNMDLISKNNLKATDLPGVMKKVKNDVSAVTATPKLITDVTTQITGMFSKIQGAFGA